MKISLTKKELETMRNILWVIQNNCETAQEPGHEDYDEDYAKIMKQLCKKFKVEGFCE